jgi:hypothetical protein
MDMTSPSPGTGGSPPTPDERPRCALVFVAHEPLVYREALAAALAALRPTVEVVVIAPEHLDVAVKRRGADFVFCSWLSEPVRLHARAWALLYPSGRQVVETCIAGQCAVAPDLGLEAALALLDRSAGGTAPADPDRAG